MYLQTEMERVLPYYQRKLPEWELNVSREIEAFDPKEFKPNHSRPYMIFGTRAGITKPLCDLIELYKLKKVWQVSSP